MALGPSVVAENSQEEPGAAFGIDRVRMLLGPEFPIREEAMGVARDDPKAGFALREFRGNRLLSELNAEGFVWRRDDLLFWGGGGKGFAHTVEYARPAG